jgi:co-chaperonin GroES (HSP10)
MLQPLDKRIIVVPIVPEPKKSCILLMKDEAPQAFGVTAIGDDVKKVNVGDIILIAAYSTSEISYEGIKYTIVNESNIIAKVV